MRTLGGPQPGDAPARRPQPPIAPLSDWLGDLARTLGADLGIPEPKVGLSYSRGTKVTIGFSDSDIRSSSPRTPKAAVAAPLT